jgi:Amt family ammonium transporter
MKLGYDDALDVVGVHGGGGLVGTLLVAVFGAGALGGWEGDMNILHQLGVQGLAIIFTLLYCGVVSVVLFKVVDLLVGLRVPVETEDVGLDLGDHGEVGYDF